MLTLKANPGIWFCRITQESFALSPVGKLVQKELLGIPGFYEQVKIGQYQIMPDHLHVLVHVVCDLPPGVTLQRIMRGFKLGVNNACSEANGGKRIRVFEKGAYDSLVFDREHLAREVAYIRDNVRRYRLLKANPELFQKAAMLMTLPDGVPLWGFGNRFLLEHPRKVAVQFSRRTTEAEWPEIEEQLADYLAQGYVFVSPFISSFEKRVLQEVVAQGGRAIRLTHRFFGERYKPAGRLFDLCSQGRLLELSVAGAFPRFARLDRAACLVLNGVMGVIATTQWSQRGAQRGVEESDHAVVATYAAAHVFNLSTQRSTVWSQFHRLHIR
ncbi:MAG: hypothetical protein A2283_16905 [Lentisphaerae bacterium RIFOXYA12_FULL_48_11]|nr:MAG: hypothetical protein A2283_16905 [Lentisphaerae bacterium RIFOXYA12_FULL_48_11]